LLKKHTTMFKDASISEINEVMNKAWNAFLQYRKLSLKQRAAFMHSIARALENSGDELIKTAMQETNLPEARLRNERTRTVFQLDGYADACERGEWLEARIDTANESRNPPKPDIRKMLVPLGPVVVFGASNFPFAYSTAGGDTASAFAAGCPVIVKAHPAHAKTSEAVAQLILKVAADHKMPEGIFAHVHGAIEVGKALVTHDNTRAVGFTGSYLGGKALFDWGNQRKLPIPVFAEMGSINPVFLFPGKLKEAAAEVAKIYAASITLGVGQFCTNPGLIIGPDGKELQQFIEILGEEIAKAVPGTMLHPGIAKGYKENREKALAQTEVSTVAVSSSPSGDNQGLPTVASASGQAFLNNPVLHQEVFGPYSLVVRCQDMVEMEEVARRLEGQLTATLMATEKDLREYSAITDAVQDICGRFIVNGVPTGVEVCLSMHHGGPFPATTDSRFTSVGADAIKRFARPLSYQGWSDSFLPDELKNGNPLGIWRTVNNELTKERVTN
jgi:alpha-ketoglutaric semialdehyde dehydrogenase